MSGAECPALMPRPGAHEMPAMETDTIIIGNGPSAMILSFILHGHLPYYSINRPHPDPLLHAKLKDNPDLLDADVAALTEHFQASRLSYSTQALPVNVLLDTLVRPSIDVDVGDGETRVEWRYVPEKAVPHLVFGNAPKAGGQWNDNLVFASWDIQTLSYASMLSLPGYSFAEHYRKVNGKDLPAFTRPTRREIMDYFSAYPEAVGIDDSFHNNQSLSGVTRTANGFFISSHNIHCKHLVLASGIFSEVLQPLPMLQPLRFLQPTPEIPLLVIGSGFSAADIIISAPTHQKILHIFKWDPEGHPSPLRSCHQHAYPEYAGVYRLMKRAALAAEPAAAKRLGKPRRTTSSPFLESRAWDTVYEGLPNAEVIAVNMQSETAVVTFRLPDGSTVERTVRGLVYATGRRGSLGYLDRPLLSDVLGCPDGAEPSPIISGETLRAKALEDLEVADDVFIIGSLTGDSLIRFAYGSCVQTAGRLIRAHTGDDKSECKTPTSSRPQSSSLRVMNGMEGHEIYHNGDYYQELEKIDSEATTRPPSSLESLWSRMMRFWRS
ncbi:hypothetical protein KXX33_008726 [Aspergillus fumigatus]|nr:hypothetical protein CNMCM8714_005259 [Aspergillus fumigatus]KMK55053.1 Oxidative stress-induced growth inhibitor [Aspergillus fumigatus Z5]KAF4261283.1 hypothetical protein CNMCM8812_004991 [Aspergillus fumigatus]KAF4295505.1 hypothetical protein CNMCM8686_008109 [Aspergillus fumigatus]KAH1277900.1 hypothetical protein KXX45_002359 [Aspergillus fumigatus]